MPTIVVPVHSTGVATSSRPGHCCICVPLYHTIELDALVLIDMRSVQVSGKLDEASAICAKEALSQEISNSFMPC